MTEPYTDLTVRTGDPKLLDRTLQQLPMCAAVVGDDTWDPAARTCLVRVYSGLGFVKFALHNQGYGEVLAEVEH